MCGIAFFASYDGGINTDYVHHTFEELQKRGNDASGYYFERTERDKPINRVVKGAVTSKELIKGVKNDPRARLNGKEKFIMLHTRLKTQGTQYDNLNNHPVFNDKYVLVHNGQIRSPRLDSYDYMGEVDTEVLLSYIDTYNVFEGIEKSFGSMAIIIKPKAKKYFFLFKNNNPLYLAYNPKKKLLFGASDDDYFKNEAKEENLMNQLTGNGQYTCKIDAGVLYKVSLTRLNILSVGKINVPSYYNANKKETLYRDGWTKKNNVWTKNHG